MGCHVMDTTGHQPRGWQLKVSLLLYDAHAPRTKLVMNAIRELNGGEIAHTIRALLARHQMIQLLMKMESFDTAVISALAGMMALRRLNQQTDRAAAFNV